jgi:hypothetical protein
MPKKRIIPKTNKLIGQLFNLDYSRAEAVGSARQGQKRPLYYFLAFHLSY